jgi:predicted Fe-Mo cluster-binding NifX family protein
MKKIAMILILAFFIPVFVFAGMEGNIAVAVEDKTANALVSQTAGRSPFFLIFDRSGKLLEIVDNPSEAERRGAGPSAVTLLSQKGVTFIVAEQFGEKMARSMKNEGIEYFEFHGSAEDALKKILDK